MGEGEGGMIWENAIETCIILYKKRITSPGSMQDTGCLVLVHLDVPEGWYGDGGGKGVQDGEHVYTRGRFMLLLLLLSRFSRARLFAILWTAAYQAPPSMGFSRQEFWSGVTLPPPQIHVNVWQNQYSIVK